MEVAIIDYLGSGLSIEVLPKNADAVILCDNFCYVPEDIQSKYLLTVNIDKSLKGGNHLIKVVNEIQRGLVLSIMFSKNKKIVVYTPRPEVITKYMPGCEIRYLSAPIQPEDPRTKSKKVPEEYKPQFADPGFPSPNKKSPSTPFEIVYKESLEKYAETILMTAVRALKSKSAKAQLRNIIVGVMISYSKKAPVKLTFDSEEVTEAIFTDLEEHGIISGSSNLNYDDDLIDKYFGKKRTMKIIPGQKLGEPKPPKSEDLHPKNIQLEHLTKIITDISSSLISDDAILACTLFSNLVRFNKNAIEAYISSENKKPLTPPEVAYVMKGLIKFEFEMFFTADSKDSIEKISSNPNDYFTMKLEIKN
jgi:hypothetical protein